jgi:hypothetical protein
VRGRCGSTNLCDYCARLKAVENSELLSIDGGRGWAPSLWAVLTTPSSSTSPADFYGAMRELRRAIRAAFPDFQAATIVEFTTGFGSGSGGQRRPHWNLLVKGILVAQAGELKALIDRHWCPRVGGDPDAQYVGEISQAGGLLRYLVLHFLKESQKPPADWSGHRFTHTRGYLWTDTPTARAEAIASLRLKRELHRMNELGLFGQEAEDAAQLALYEASELAWELVREQRLPNAFGEDGLPSGWDRTFQPV